MIDFEKALSLLERIDSKYKQYIQMLNESQIINEADSRLKAVDRIIDQVFSKYFNPDDTVRSSEYYVNDNPNTTWRQYLLFNLRHTFGLMQNSDIKYLPLVARLAYSDEVRFDIANDNGEQINTLRRIVNLLKKDANLFNEVKSNPNITFAQLAERFKDAFAQEDTEDARKANEVDGTNSEYTVKEVSDFETAKYYGDRSCSRSKLCYTQSENTWNSYTKNGMNRVYVCLKNGWENIPEVATDGNPYDEYGTSMIFVFVNPKGNLVTSNCRWNHENQGEYNGDVDHAFTKSTLSQTIGMPFDSVFKPFDIDKETYISKAIEDSDYETLRDIAVGDFVIPDGTRVIGDYVFQYFKNLTSVTIPNSVISIGECAFNACTSLTSINIPNSVTSIERFVFKCCSSLTSITIPNSVTIIRYGAFEECRSLTNITIPNSVIRIGSWAFQNCTSLTKIILPNNVTSIGRFAFDGCYGLTIYVQSEETADLVRKSGFEGNIQYVNNQGVNESMSQMFSLLERIDPKYKQYIHTLDEAHEIKNYYLERNFIEKGQDYPTSPHFAGDVVIPNGVTVIGENVFSLCENLTSVVIPNSVKIIKDRAFYKCTNLKSINIPSSVISIGRSAFEDCRNLRSINIPDSVTTIGGAAFEGCHSLTSIIIPNSVTKIDYNTFMYCKSLTSAVIPNSVKTIGAKAFCCCTSLTSVTIPDSVTTIGEGAFDSCASLTSINIPNSVTTIGGCAFKYCTALTDITIPNSVRKICYSAFEECHSITSIIIPNSVTTIGEDAFYNCSRLTSVIINAVTPPEIYPGAFGKTNNCPIYVPAESVSAYKRDNQGSSFNCYGWQVYKSQIQPIPTK